MESVTLLGGRSVRICQNATKNSSNYLYIINIITEQPEESKYIFNRENRIQMKWWQTVGVLWKCHLLKSVLVCLISKQQMTTDLDIALIRILFEPKQSTGKYRFLIIVQETIWRTNYSELLLCMGNISTSPTWKERYWFCRKEFFKYLLTVTG